MLDIFVHQLLVLVIFLTGLIAFMEVFIRSNVTLELLRSSFILLQANWFWQVRRCSQLMYLLSLAGTFSLFGGAFCSRTQRFPSDVRPTVTLWVLEKWYFLEQPNDPGRSTDRARREVGCVQLHPTSEYPLCKKFELVLLIASSCKMLKQLPAWWVISSTNIWKAGNGGN